MRCKDGRRIASPAQPRTKGEEEPGRVAWKALEGIDANSGKMAVQGGGKGLNEAQEEGGGRG